LNHDSRRVWLHTRTAEAIEATYAQRPQRVMPYTEALAFHYELSDRREKALPYLVQAAQKASGLFALEVANDYLERALALMDELGVQNPADRWPILEQLGNLATILADTTRAVDRYEQALNLAPSDDWQPEPGDQVRLHRYASRALITAGKPDVAVQHLQAAEEIMGDAGQASLDYEHLLYDVALWHWHNNDYQEAFETAQRNLDLAERLNDDRGGHKHTRC
jgi:tetratricopeptide (TPR) repeat protein